MSGPGVPGIDLQKRSAMPVARLTHLQDEEGGQPFSWHRRRWSSAARPDDDDDGEL